MRSARLALALETGAFRLPASGDVAVFRPVATDDLTALPKARLTLVQGFKPDHDALAAQGYRVAPVLPAADYGAAVVCLPRAREAGRALMAEAAEAVAPGGPVAVDGQKTDGIDTALRDLRVRMGVGEPLSKAHGKLFSFAAGPGLSDWTAAYRHVEGGFVTRPGVFSADGPDRGSVLLAAALPARLPGRGVDLGAGWGYLARAALAREGVTTLDLVEAEAEALDCARMNVPDARAAFHWADAATWKPVQRADWVICNPPFHASRSADPGLGLAFLQAAARILSLDGSLWLVANRHLPYEAALTTLFREVEVVGGDTAFRVTRASRPVPRR